MFRILFILFVLILFLFPAGETQAVPKPPARICAQLVDMADPGNLLRLVLLVKSSGTMKTADGPTPFYALNGFAFSQPGADPWNYPLVGTGYIYKGDDQFYFSFGGSTVFSGTFFSAYMYGYWGLVHKSGFIIADITGTKGGVTGDNLVSFMMTEVSCDAMEIPEPPNPF